VYVGINQGTIVFNGATAAARFRYGKEANGSWPNQGTVRLQGGTVELIGSYSAATLGKVQHVGGQLIYGGVYDNQGQILELTRNTSIQGDVLGGTIRVTAGETAMASGRFRGDTTVSRPGQLQLAELLANNLTLDQAKLIIAGQVTAQSFAGIGQLILRGGQLQTANATELVVAPEVTLGAEGTNNSLSLPVTNRGVIAIGADAALGLQSLVNHQVVKIGERGYLEVSEAIRQPPDAGAMWFVGPGARLRVRSDLSLGERDHTTVYLTTDPKRQDTLQADGTFTQAGVLDVRLADGRPPRPGQSFRLITAAGIAGQFQDVTLPLIPRPFGWDVSQLGTAGTIEMVGPEAEVFAGTHFISAPVGSSQYEPLPGDRELGFASQSVPTGVNPGLGVELDPNTLLKHLTHRSVAGVT
jgi:hypothetical protein